MTTAQRPSVVRSEHPILRDGKELHWCYWVPLERGGTLFGWRETQPEALRACCALIRDIREGRWT